ncbi:hypothetical protein HBI04_181230 [Parastagonospora nodorum]|nr:hypothetical protein HBH51_151390 [Parastagonospora nodorum]KAH4121166.1 hypothetical protein HBH47_099580 [Parastagonospora nodorum]KAH4265688.1 hypothetical protein HBI04_181230 [Parastagonospora nodorum]KAH4941113.1 hypothetical protein HBI79_032850 [Parastagonospora nodorum]KAH4972647.1 hypothetical protein HBI78_010630 [Parastagonospora nodorum]
MHPRACLFMKRIKARAMVLVGKFKHIRSSYQNEKTHAKQQLTAEMDRPVRAQPISQRHVPLKLLGEGGNGQVHLCRDAKLGSLVAVKTVHHSEPSSPLVEAEILSFLGQNANIVRYHGVLKHQSQDFYMQLVFEYCELGDLADYIESTMVDEVIPEMFIWHTLKHIASGLHFIHSAGVVHGDIKCQNILLSPAAGDQAYPTTLKIADFGAAERNPRQDVPLGHAGTIGFQAPETIMRHGPEGDIWGLGCIIHEMTAFRLPEIELTESIEDEEAWFHQNGMVIPKRTIQPRRYKAFCHYMAHHPAAPTRIDEAPLTYSKLLNHFMMRTLDVNYQKRITAYELQRSLPVLETLARNLRLSGQEFLLNAFNDGQDGMWKQINMPTDSKVFEQIFQVLAFRARKKQDAEVLMLANPLLEIMNSVEQVTACQFFKQLGSSQYHL